MAQDDRPDGPRHDQQQSSLSVDAGVDVSPSGVAGDRSAPSAREARLAAALRENLKRRKTQARGRSSVDAQDEAPLSGGPASPTAE